MEDIEVLRGTWHNRAMTQPSHLHPDRLFPASEPAHSIARDLYPAVRDLPIVSPHGHTDPAWFAQNHRFSSPTALFLTPDHYLLRMLKSRGIDYDALGIPRKDGKPVETKVGALPKSQLKDWIAGALAK